MLLFKGKKKENVAEYLLYMWQTEDIIRAFSLDPDKIKKNLIDVSKEDEKGKKETFEWYESLIDMMKSEGVEKQGHLQINKNVIIQLEDLHQELLHMPQETTYKILYNRVVPYIIELQKKGNKDKSEIEICMDFMYGIFLLKLQKKEISEGTKQVFITIREFIKLLSAKYKEDVENGLDKNI